MTMPQILTRPDLDQRTGYPTSDGRPMAETDLHRDDMFDLIESLKLFYEGQMVYVSGNILVHYRPGYRRKHVSPDVLVVKDLDPHRRDNYLIWEEGKSPDLVIEVTSESTRDEDLEDKYELYQDVLQVREYFLFDPRGEYLKPPVQGYRLVEAKYVAIEPESGRLPSEVLGLHLEKHGTELRLYDPATGQWIPTPKEARERAEAARQQAEAARRQAEAARRQAETARRQAETARRQAEAACQQAELGRQQEQAAKLRAEAELERLRQELEALRKPNRD